MKVFLLEFVPGLGSKGDIKEVADGYGCNFLIPRRLAVAATAEYESDILGRKAQLQVKNEVEKKRRSALSDRIESLRLSFVVKAHDDGKLYGSIGSDEIAEKLSEHGVSVTKNQIVFDDGKAFKKTGSFTVQIKLSSTLRPVLKFKIVAE